MNADLVGNRLDDWARFHLAYHPFRNGSAVGEIQDQLGCPHARHRGSVFVDHNGGEQAMDCGATERSRSRQSSKASLIEPSPRQCVCPAVGVAILHIARRSARMQNPRSHAAPQLGCLRPGLEAGFGARLQCFDMAAQVVLGAIPRMKSRPFARQKSITSGQQ
jgi:hypothetical protein